MLKLPDIERKGSFGGSIKLTYTRTEHTVLAANLQNDLSYNICIKDAVTIIQQR
jgi:hypothetical protein